MIITIKHLKGLDPIEKKEDSQPFIKSLKSRTVNAFPNLYVTFDLLEQPLPDPVISLRTSPGSRKQSDPDMYEWNESVEIPIDSAHFQSPGTELRFVVWDLFGPQKASPVYYATVPLAGKEGLLEGGYDFRLTEVKDQARTHHASETPSAYSPSPMMSLSIMGDDDVDYDDNYDDLYPLRESAAGTDVLSASPLHQGSSIRAPVLTIEFRSSTRNVTGNGDSSPTMDITDAVDPAEIMHAGLCSFREDFYDTNDVLIPSLEQMDAIRSVMNKLYFEEISPEDQGILHMFGPFLRRDPNALLYFLRTVDWKNPGDCMYAKELMETWSPPPLAYMILLMSQTYSNEYVFEYAVKRLKRDADDKFLSTYMPQLIWALSVTSKFKRNPLRDFLLEKAGGSPALGWLFKVYIGPINNSFFDDLKEQFRTDSEVKKIVELNTWLMKTAKEIKATKGTKIDCEQAKKELKEKLNYSKMDNSELKEIIKSHTRLPVDPFYTVVGVDLEGSTVFDSNNRPIKVNFSCKKEDDNANEEGEEKEVSYPIVFKVGDDMTQDVLILQAMSIMDNILKDNGLDMKMCFYKALALGNDGNVPYGIMECVKDTKPVKLVTNEDINVNNDIYMENLTHSYIGSSVITYILGIGDRHKDNILMKKDGTYLHIDFGFVFGENPIGKSKASKIRTVDVISKAVLKYIEEKKLTKEDFVDEFIKVYMILRNNANLIIGLFEVRKETKLFESRKDPVEYLKETLAIGKTEEEASAQVRGELSKSENNPIDWLIDFFHQ